MQLSSHNQKLFKKLKQFNLPNDQYTIFGSGPLGIRNLRDINDLDIIVTQKLWQILIKKYNQPDHEPLQLAPDINTYKTWPNGNWDIKKLIKDSETIDGLRFVPLEIVLKWKKSRNKTKDQADIKLISGHQLT